MTHSVPNDSSGQRAIVLTCSLPRSLGALACLHHRFQLLPRNLARDRVCACVVWSVGVCGMCGEALGMEGAACGKYPP